MHSELDSTAQQQYTAADLRSAYLDAQQTATLRTIDPGATQGPDSSSGRKVVTVPIGIGTVAFGHVDADLELPFADGGIAWDPHLVFPGLRAASSSKTRSNWRTAARSSPATAPAGRRARRRPANTRWAAPRSTSPAKSARPKPPTCRRSPGRASRPEPRSGSAASSRPSTAASPASRAARCSPSARMASSARILAQAEPAAGRAGEDDDRSRPCRRPPSPRSPAAPAASPSSTPAAATSARSPGRPSRPRSRPARPSR